ncbi:helix-turn-helix domain-containing protein, partial [Bacillus thuringiensis]|nr:helix-turn-helix domain-containing protein [Bacillus thuringiensis]
RLYKEVGRTLRVQRKQQGLSLDSVSKQVGISINYLSELEKGDKGKVPSDNVLQRLITILNLNEKELYVGFGKIPLSVVEELQSNEKLLSILYGVIHNPNVSREDFYNDMQKLYFKYASRSQG